MDFQLPESFKLSGSCKTEKMQPNATTCATNATILFASHVTLMVLTIAMV
jgi:hypothetical protein